MPGVLPGGRERSLKVGLQFILLKCRVYFGGSRRRVEPDQYKVVAEVAGDLSAMMEIWFVDGELQTKAHIAYRHRLVENYRGYLLCSDTTGHTFLINTRTHTYVKGSALLLLQIDGVDQAKCFVDELCSRLPINC